jgi:AcrR family transcriptional regulator
MTRPSKSLHAPRRQPQQQRSREAVEAIREACLRILQEEGPAALNTNRIAEVAGVNIASLYRFFPNKEAIVAQLYESALEEWDRAITALGAREPEILGYSLPRAVRLVVRGTLRAHRRLLALDAPFYREHHRGFDAMSRKSPHGRPSEVEQLENWFRRLFERHRHHLRVDDLELASFISVRVILELLHASVSDRPELLEDPALEDEIVTLVLRYIGAEHLDSEGGA